MSQKRGIDDEDRGQPSDDGHRSEEDDWDGDWGNGNVELGGDQRRGDDLEERQKIVRSAAQVSDHITQLFKNRDYNDTSFNQTYYGLRKFLDQMRSANQMSTSDKYYETFIPLFNNLTYYKEQGVTIDNQILGLHRYMGRV